MYDCKCLINRDVDIITIHCWRLAILFHIHYWVDIFIETNNRH